MGSSQSSHASAKNLTKDKPVGRSVRGRKSIPVVESVDEAVVVLNRDASEEPGLAVALSDDFESEATDDTDTYSPSDEEEEEDEELLERLRILEEARNLKKLAEAFLHPEKPVEVDGVTKGRNYFSRASAPETEALAESEERASALADAAALKQFANHYAHPEVSIETPDPAACGRSYYGRVSAVPQRSAEEAEETALVMEDIVALKQAARDYLHPEAKVETSDGETFGRNYFERLSVVQRETEEERLERSLVLAESAALKKLAVDFAHPEAPMLIDSSARGRNFFDRPSAPGPLESEETEERAKILAEAAALTKLAADFLRPEMPVEVEPAAFGRNYFDRPSSLQQEEMIDASERAMVLAEAAALKKLALNFAHPEAPLKSAPETFGRNFYSRPSAVENEDTVDADERAQVVAEAAALKKLAVNFAHPEMRVQTDPSTFARNYFERSSAVEQEDKVEAEERAQILAEAAALKEVAVNFAHPERPVETDPVAFGRSYFDRPSLVEQEDDVETEERAQILAEAAALKKLAVNFAHPEMPVDTDPAVFGRNYFSRPSMIEQEDAVVAEECAQILVEAAALKKLAVDHAHPELGVLSSNPTAFGRNYYSWPSVAPAGHAESSKVAEAPASQEQFLVGMPDQLQSKHQPVVVGKTHKAAAAEGSDEGNMSRSPSSVMLFGLEDNHAF